MENAFRLETGSQQVVCDERISTGLKPGNATVLSAEKLEGDKCRIKLSIPVNIDVNDTYTYFVSCRSKNKMESPDLNNFRIWFDN